MPLPTTMPLPPTSSALTDAALSTATAGRLHQRRAAGRAHPLPTVRLRDAAPEGSSDDTEFGMGVRVVVDGAVGFAATVDVRPAEAANLVRSAIETARVTARAGGGRVELAPEPSHGEVSGRARSRSTRARAAGRQGRPARGVEPAAAGARRRLAHVTAEVLSVGEETYLADLNGTGPPSAGCACTPSSRRWRSATVASRPCAPWPRRSAGAGST
jgi:TldD protein